MQIKDLLRILISRWKIFVPAVLVVIAVHFIVATRPTDPSYTATSKVVVGVDRVIPVSNAGLLPALAERALSHKTRQSTITDYPVLRFAAELARGDRAFRSHEFGGDRYAQAIYELNDAMFQRYGGGEAGLERLTEDLLTRVSLSTYPERQIVDVHVRYDDPSLAMALSWCVVEGAHLYHDEKSRENTESFLAELRVARSQAEAELERAYLEMVETQRSLGLSDFDEKERLILQNIYHLEDLRIKLVSESKRNESLLSFRANEAALPRSTETPSAERKSETIQKVRELLLDARLDLEVSQAMYTSRHPELMKSEAMVEGLQRALAIERGLLTEQENELFVQETRDLVREDALLGLQRKVIDERVKALEGDLVHLAGLRAEFSPKRVAYDLAQQRFQHLQGLEKDVLWSSKGQRGAITVYDPATRALEEGPSHFSTVSLALVCLMAFIFASGLACLAEYLDTRVKDENDVRQLLHLPILSMIPRDTESGGLLLRLPQQSEIAEKFDTAAALVERKGREGELRTIMVCSATPGEGKTSVAINMAVALARRGNRVLIVDGDLRAPRLDALFGLPNERGLTSALSTIVDRHRVEGILVAGGDEGGEVDPESLLQRGPVPGLMVLTSGPAKGDPVNLLSSGRVERLFRRLSGDFDFVIVDSPPINKVADALTISAVVDSSIFVVGSGDADQNDVIWAKHLLVNVDAQPMGVVLNKYAGTRTGGGYYYGSKRRRDHRDRSSSPVQRSEA